MVCQSMSSEFIVVDENASLKCQLSRSLVEGKNEAMVVELSLSSPEEIASTRLEFEVWEKDWDRHVIPEF